jgi:hypothetical protein
VVYVESVRKENATLHPTVKKKNMAVAILQQKKPVAGIAHGNTQTMQIKDVKLEVQEEVVAEQVELHVHQQNDVEVGDKDGVKVLCTN